MAKPVQRTQGRPEHAEREASKPILRKLFYHVTCGLDNLSRRIGAAVAIDSRFNALRVGLPERDPIVSGRGDIPKHPSTTY